MLRLRRITLKKPFFSYYMQKFVIVGHLSLQKKQRISLFQQRNRYLYASLCTIFKWIKTNSFNHSICFFKCKTRCTKIIFFSLLNLYFLPDECEFYELALTCANKVFSLIDLYRRETSFKLQTVGQDNIYGWLIEFHLPFLQFHSNDSLEFRLVDLCFVDVIQYFFQLFFFFF